MLKSLIQGFLNRAGIEAVRSATLHRFLQTRDIDLLVDVGANLGQFAHKARSVGYTGRIISIEPASHMYEGLVRAKVPQPWEHRQTALGAEVGEADLGIPSNHTLASIKKMSSNASSLLGFDTSNKLTERIPVTTLDHLLEKDPSQRLFVKIDTQGYEREVLLGATKTLDRTIGILLELPLEHLYENVWSFTEALLFMNEIGFVPAQFRTVNVLAHDSASAIEIDCIFRPKN